MSERQLSERQSGLRATLAQLHEQLEGAEPVDEALRVELRAAMQEIETLLEADEPAPSGDGASFSGRLSGLALRFEGSHPRLSEAVNRLVHGLAELGI